MNTTRRSLLARVRNLDDQTAWDEFYELYAPLMYRFARRHGLTPDDADEVRDQCLEVLARRMPDFAYDPSIGRFKSWLYRVVSGRIIDLRRRRVAQNADTAELKGLVDPQPTPTQAWEQHWRKEHLKYSLERSRLLVSERNYRAFEMLVEEKTVSQVCDALSMNPNQVYKAKMQVLQRVRRIMESVGS